MAAVFALVFLFALVSSILMVAIAGQVTFGVIAATLCFVVLAAGVFAGLFQMTRHWEAGE